MHAADLRLVFWETTAACNLACKHCRRLELDATRDELTTAEAKFITNKALFADAKADANAKADTSDKE